MNDKPSTNEKAATGVAGLDEILGGGLLRNRIHLAQGGPGTGKTSLCTLYAYAAARRGQHSAIYIFEERRGTFFARAEGLGMADIKSFEQEGIFRPTVQ